MNSVVIILLSIFTLLLGYRLYAKKIESLWEIDPQRPPPSITRYDGIDYVPSKHWMILFGHHFASIAGAGPIIGPVIAICLWGWVPALIWILCGSIFFGGIHDFGALIISVKEEGKSLGEIASKSISHKAKMILSIFIWLSLLLVIAVFAYLGAKSFVEEPKIVIPSLGIIPISVLVGLGLYRFRLNPVIVTIFGLLSLGGLVVLGQTLPFALGKNSQLIWIIVLFLYCYCASIIPVNYLLQPRDYLSSFLLMGGIALALIGIFTSHPKMNGPGFIAWKSPMGFLWPMMFITVACGANSGFHSLISSGTTSKQLANERYARRIGFGGMLMEGFLAVIVIVVVVAGFSASELSLHIASKTNPIQIYGLGFGNITKSLCGSWGTFIALTILNAFILTTLDSATRISRYITQELFGVKNRFLSTAFVILLGAWLALGKDQSHNPLWQKIWPAFGASNQLIAALTLLVISCWLLSKNRPTTYSLIPALFMLITSLSALAIQTTQYIRNKDFVLMTISVILIVSALYLGKEVFVTFRRRIKNA